MDQTFLRVLVGVAVLIAAGLRPTASGAAPASSAQAPPPTASPSRSASSLQLSSPLISQADTLSREQKYEEALSLYLKAYEITPLPSLLLAIGLCHAALDQLPQAKQRCDEFESSVPAPSAKEATDLAECRKQVFARENSNAGVLAYQKGDFKKARESFEAAYAIINSPDFLRNIAQCYQSEERWADMLDRCLSFEKAVPNASEADREFITSCKRIANHGIHKQECITAFSLKDYGLALAACGSAYEATRDRSVLLRRGVAAAQLGSFARARTDCGQYESETTVDNRPAPERELLLRCQTLIAQSEPRPAPPPKAPEGEPLYRKKWFLPVVIAAGVLAVTAVGVGIGAGVAANQTPPYMDIIWRP